jgi:large subunit ribosomal protein L2
MALKTFNPTSAGRRHLIQVDRAGLFKGKPVKSLTEGQSKSGGRGNTGRITSRRKGGGHKTNYRVIDFKRTQAGTATVERLEYDPNRTAFIALIKYQDGSLSYILAPQRLAVGDTVESGAAADVKPGNAMPIGSVPVGTVVHNVETKPGAGGSLARSAGTYVMVAGRDGANVIIKLKSGETRMVAASCMEGLPPGLARYRPQPCGPPERWPHQWWQALGHALGQTHQGQEDAHQQAHNQVHRAVPP